MLVRLLVVELFKLYRGKHVWVTAGIFALTPSLFALTIQTKSANVTVEGTYSFATYSFAMIGILRSLLVPYLAGIILAATTLAQEKDNGILKMFLIRCPNRWLVYLAKFLAVKVIMLGYLIITIFSSVISHTLLLSSNEIAAPLESSHLWDLLWATVAALGGTTVVIGVTLLISISSGFTGAVMGGMGFLFTLKLLENLEVVRGFLPTVMADATYFLSRTDGPTPLRVVVLLSLYGGTLVSAGMIWLERKDITR